MSSEYATNIRPSIDKYDTYLLINWLRKAAKSTMCVLKWESNEVESKYV